jgi:hypothetical protein
MKRKQNEGRSSALDRPGIFCVKNPVNTGDLASPTGDSQRFFSFVAAFPKLSHKR